MAGGNGQISVQISLIQDLEWNLKNVSDIVKDCGFGVFTGAT